VYSSHLLVVFQPGFIVLKRFWSMDSIMSLESLLLMVLLLVWIRLLDQAQVWRKILLEGACFPLFMHSVQLKAVQSLEIEYFM
jgi:hypothetical protein